MGDPGIHQEASFAEAPLLQGPAPSEGSGRASSPSCGETSSVAPRRPSLPPDSVGPARAPGADRPTPTAPISPDSAKARWRAPPRPCRARPRDATHGGGRPQAQGPAAPRGGSSLNAGPRPSCAVRRGCPRVSRQHVRGKLGPRRGQRGVQLPAHGPPGHCAPPTPGGRSSCQGRSRPGCQGCLQLQLPETALRQARRPSSVARNPETRLCTRSDQRVASGARCPSPWASVLPHVLVGPSGPGAVQDLARWAKAASGQVRGVPVARPLGGAQKLRRLRT